MKKPNCCISCMNWLGWITTLPICSAGPVFSERKREKEKGKDHTFTRASTWWHGWLTALLHSSSNSSIKIFMSLSVRRLLTYVTYPSRDPTAALYKDHLKMDGTIHTIWFFELWKDCYLSKVPFLGRTFWLDFFDHNFFFLWF